MKELVFIHGWGFDAGFWNPLASLLRHLPQRRIDLGFFGATKPPTFSAQKDILIGHSLGFPYGLLKADGWAGCIAINSFKRFVNVSPGEGCVELKTLDSLRLRVKREPVAALDGFYNMLKTDADAKPKGPPNTSQLIEVLQMLETLDIEETLRRLRVPSLVLAGTRDPLVPMYETNGLSAILAEIGENRSLSFENGGHMLPRSHPEWCGEAIQAFYDRIS